MNIELTRIAQKKIKQMGGTPCGVLVCNEAGALACVSEHGRVTWMDDFEGQAATDREDALDCALSRQSYTERLIDSAHAELCGMAYDLMLSHTVSGEWPETEADTRAKHDQLIALAGELRRLKESRAQDDVKRCSWWRDMADWDGNTWEADCGACWVFIDEGPVQNEMNYCPKCGRKMSQLPSPPTEREGEA